MTIQETLSQLRNDVATQDSEIIQQPPKVVICTGISGCDRWGYLKSVQQIAEQAGKELKIFDVGSMMFQSAPDLGIPISDKKILDLSAPALRFLRGIVFEEIINDIKKYRHSIVATRTCFRWNKYLTPAFDVYYLKKLNELASTMYVTIIDTYDVIKQRLDEVPQWTGRLNLREILIWRDEETFITELLASYQEQPHYIIGRDEPPETLYHLMFTPGATKAFGSL